MYDWQQAVKSPRESRFEDQRVKYVLEEFRMMRHLRSLLDDGAERYGDRRLTFDGFDAMFPSFPIRLDVHCQGHVAEHCPPSKMFRDFGATFLYRRYLETYVRFQGDAFARPIGLVLPFDGFYGGMVIHNGIFDTRVAKMSFPVPGDVPPYLVTVEPFRSLISYLAQSGWTPRRKRAGKAKPQAKQVRQRIMVNRMMIRKVGSGPTLVILGWLRMVLLSSSGYERHFVRRIKDNVREIDATGEQIAAETGLSLRQVQRGLARLRKVRLIATKRRQGGNGIILAEEVRYWR